MNGVCDCVQAYYSALVLAETRNKYQEFCIPIVVIPATINNNVPGTEFCIGSDTALNEIVSVSRPTGNTTTDSTTVNSVTCSLPPSPVNC